jgi:cell pole-organizing protein PopZ
MAAPLQNKDESVADILSAIKNIVEGGTSNNNTVEALDSNDDDLLELTDVVEEIGVETTFEQPQARRNSEAPSEKPVDILDQIDSEFTATQNASQKEMLESIKEEIIQDHPQDFSVVADEPAQQEASVAAPEVQTSEPQKVEAVVHEDTSAVQNAPKTENVVKTVLLSAEKAQKSSQAIKNLLDNIPKTEIISPAMRNGTTIEDILVESLKPLLKEWLDQNLETIVRDVVEREIKKLVPKED